MFQVIDEEKRTLAKKRRGEKKSRLIVYLLHTLYSLSPELRKMSTPQTIHKTVSISYTLCILFAQFLTRSSIRQTKLENSGRQKENKTKNNKDNKTFDQQYKTTTQKMHNKSYEIAVK